MIYDFMMVLIDKFMLLVKQFDGQKQALLWINVVSKALCYIYSDLNYPFLEELMILLPKSSSGV